jgi:site-specific DNA recombinase
MTEGVRRAFAYLRVSTTEQSTNGLSLDAQRARLRESASAYGYRVERYFTDSISGGASPEKRPGLSEALQRLRAGEARCLVVTRLDRLSRSTAHSLRLIELADKERWEVVSLSEQLDTATPGGRFTTTLLFALAQMERELIGERTREAMNQVRREGRACSRYVQFGFRVSGEPGLVTVKKGDRRPLVPYDPEQGLLACMQSLQRAGKGAFAISSYLNRAGVLNPRTGRPWSPGGVATILQTASRYLGLAPVQKPPRASSLNHEEEKSSGNPSPRHES